MTEQAKLRKGSALIGVAMGIALAVFFVLAYAPAKVSIVGTWADSDGYYIEFKDDGQYIESSYNTPMSYVISNNTLVYYWADGTPYTTQVKKTLFGKLKMEFNGKERVMTKTDNDVLSYSWTLAGVDRNDGLRARYDLVSNVGMQSSIFLSVDDRYSWIYGAQLTEERLSRWRETGDDVMPGMYAENDKEIILYYQSAEECEILKRIDSGKIVATCPMQTDLQGVKAEYLNPLTIKGYTIYGSALERLSGVSYRFKDEGYVVAMTTNGKSVQYTYKVEPNGLVTLSAIDGNLASDYLYLDIDNQQLYRLVYRLNSWQSFVSEIHGSNETVQANGPSGDATQKLNISDSGRMEERLCKYNPLKAAPIIQMCTSASTYISNLAQEIEERKQLEEQEIRTAELLREQEESERQMEHDRLQELAQQKLEEARELAPQALYMLEYARASGDTEPVVSINGVSYYSKEDMVLAGILDADYPLPEFEVDDITGEVTQITGYMQDNEDVPQGHTDYSGDFIDEAVEHPESGLTNLNNQINTEQIGQQATVKEETPTQFYVVYLCNCADCHTSDYPVPMGDEAIAVTNGKVFPLWSRIRVVTSNGVLYVTVGHIAEDMESNMINVYIGDHQKWLTLMSGYADVERI